MSFVFHGTRAGGAGAGMAVIPSLTGFGWRAQNACKSACSHTACGCELTLSTWLCFLFFRFFFLFAPRVFFLFLVALAAASLCWRLACHFYTLFVTLHLFLLTCQTQKRAQHLFLCLLPENTKKYDSTLAFPPATQAAATRTTPPHSLLFLK